MIEKAVLHSDGGSRGNPGPSGIGFVLSVAEANENTELKTIAEGGAYIGEATNNVAEYQALLWGLQNALSLGVEHLEIRADSELMIKQINGVYKVKSEGIKPLFLDALQALRAFKSFTASHVYREDNSRADALANEAMDSRASVGNYQVSCKASAEEPIEERRGGTLSIPFEDAENAAPPAMSKGGTTMTEGVYTLAVKNHFDAAHALVGYPGECCNLHGHTWDIEAIVSGTELDEVGIVYDFKTLKADLAQILDDYDHKYLNEVPPFDTINATAENLARVIYERLEEKLPANIALDEIAVWESPIAKLTYRRK